MQQVSLYCLSLYYCALRMSNFEGRASLVQGNFSEFGFFLLIDDCFDYLKQQFSNLA